MRGKHFFNGNVLLSILVGFFILASAQQPVTRCPSDETDPNAPNYKVGLANHAGKRSRALYLFISIDAEHFIRKDMIALAKRLNRDFCYEDELNVVILDDYHAARHPVRNSKSYLAAERGLYHLDRYFGQQYIKFSTARGKPQDEVVVNLSSEMK